MAVTTLTAQVLRFDTFELNMRAGELRKLGRKLRLQGQPLQVLAILLQAAGELVTREEIQKQIWPADTFVDFNHSLHNAIGRVREALGDSAETPRYIETLPRRGYRFIGQVEEVLTPKPVDQVQEEKSEVVAAAGTRRSWRRAVLAIVGVCGVVAISGYRAVQHFNSKRAAPTIRSLAVLPMGNFSGDPAQDYFADGMTEELITELSRIQALKVISRTSVMEYKGSKKHLPQIARELGVDGIVEGSVSREGDQVRVTVQLLDGPNDKHIWSENFQREVGGILALQQEMAQAIAQQIRVQVSPQQGPHSAARTVKPEAYDAYLKGRFYLSTRFSKPRELKIAKGYFEEAVEKDPSFALGYVGLADCYVYLASFRELAPDLAYQSAKQALRKALELDNSIGEAHDTLALLSWQYEGDKATTEREFNYAVALAPNYACAHADRSTYLSWIGKREEALAEITKSRELDPGYSFAVTESGARYQFRDYQGLVEASQRGVVSDPNEWLEHYFLGVGLEGTGKRAEAIGEYQKAIAMSDGDQDATAALAHAYAASGKRAEAQKILNELEAKSKTGYVSPYMLATIHAGLGNKTKALEYLEQAHQEKSWDLVWELKSDLRLDTLRGEPRFQKLVRQVS